MSRKQLRLEGNSIEEVLKKVEDSFGNTAHVIGAEKVRTGGIGGFFAREFVVVTVDVPEGISYQDNGTASVEKTASTRASDVHTERTTISIDVQPHRGSAPQTRPAPATKPSTSFTMPDQLSQVNRRQSNTPKPAGAATGANAALGGIEALLAAADLADGFVESESKPSAQQTPKEYESRGTNRTTAMYSRVREPQIPDNSIMREPRLAQISSEIRDVLQGKPGAQPHIEYTRAETSRPEAAAPAAPAASASPAASSAHQPTPGPVPHIKSPPEVKPAVFEILMPEKHQDASEERSATPMVWPTATPTATSTARERDFDEVLRTAKALSQETNPLNNLAHHNIQAPVKQRAQTYKTRHDGATLIELANCGVPRRILESLPPDRTVFTLSEVMRHVPVPPKFWPDAGSIVVILGIGTSSYTSAKIVAAQLGILERDITAAGPLSAEIGGSQLVLTAQSARELRRTARETHDTALVFLDVGQTQTDWYLAGRLLSALDPDYTMATVRADNDMTHVARALQEINEGRHIFSIAAEGVISSHTPARVLQLGVPVSHIDQMEANVVVWAAALSQALPQITWD